MSGESPTGRGFTQGSDSYSAYDVAWDIRERLRMARDRIAAGEPCPYCGQSPAGMDVDRCPIHGIGCT